MKYLKSIYESDRNDTQIFKEHIDWQIIEDAKEMSLEYLDENSNLFLNVDIRYLFNIDVRNKGEWGNYIKDKSEGKPMKLKKLTIYNCDYRYEIVNEDWYYTRRLKDLKKINPDLIKYYFYLGEYDYENYIEVDDEEDEGPNFHVALEETYGLQERLKSMYKIEDAVVKNHGSYKLSEGQSE